MKKEEEECMLRTPPGENEALQLPIWTKTHNDRRDEVEEQKVNGDLRDGLAAGRSD
jgi:hypothetical protein